MWGRNYFGHLHIMDQMVCTKAEKVGKENIQYSTSMLCVIITYSSLNPFQYIGHIFSTPKCCLSSINLAKTFL